MCVGAIMLFIFFHRKAILDPVAEDPNYNPLPEDERPGGFDWGEGQAPQQDQEGEEENQQR